jgi:AcrR family transcriptional regulator
MQEHIKPRKIHKQSRSRKPLEEILQATARLLNNQPLGEVTTDHIARKTGISIGTLYKYYPNKDSILADLSLMYLQKDAELFERIFEKYADRELDELLDGLVEALMQIHKEDTLVRGVVYQNLERLKLLDQAQNTRQRIHEKETVVVLGLDPALMWVAISAINSAIHSMSQLPQRNQSWPFAKDLCRHALGLLLKFESH